MNINLERWVNDKIVSFILGTDCDHLVLRKKDYTCLRCGKKIDKKSLGETITFRGYTGKKLE